ncbi:MAG: hypothetical protein Kow0069_20670 [Promethearchaeota archaeon]
MRRPQDVAYYRTVWGFDPESDRAPLPGGGFRYEVDYELLNDPALHAAGVRVCARVDVDGEGTHNRIVFKQGGGETAVYCTHTAVLAAEVPVEELDLAVSKAAGASGASGVAVTAGVAGARGVAGPVAGDGSSGFEPAAAAVVDALPPEEHFASLKSYVAGLAEVGLANVLVAAHRPAGVDVDALPFGFNPAMQAQVVAALRALSPDALQALILDFLVKLVRVVPVGWFDDKLQAFDRHFLGRPGLAQARWELHSEFGILAYLFTDVFPKPEAFERLLGACPSWRFRKLAARYWGTHARALEVLSTDPDWGVRAWVQNHPRAGANLRRNAQELDGSSLAGGGLVAFNGVSLAPAEASVLARLELLAGKPLPPVDRVELVRGGFAAAGGRVTELSLSGHYLRELPAAVATLGALEVLALDNNRLSSLPGGLSALDRLRGLHLAGNRLGRVPSAAFALPRLRVLDLSYNRLRSLDHDRTDGRGAPAPAWSGRLRVLLARGNKLERLPDWLAGLFGLEILDLSNNALGSDPSWPRAFLSACRLPKLRVLALAGNKIGALPGASPSPSASPSQPPAPGPAAAPLSRLERLSLAGNFLSALPAWLGSCRRLRELDLRGNALRALPGEILELEGLTACLLHPGNPALRWTGSDPVVDALEERGVFTGRPGTSRKKL